MKAIKTTLTAIELGQLVGLGERMVRHMAQNGILAPDSSGEYDPVPSLAAMVKHYRSKGENNSKDETSRLKNQLLEIKVEQAAGRLVEIEVIKSAMLKLIYAAKSRFLSLPSRMAQRVSLCSDPVEIERELTREVHDALLELSKAEWLNEAKT